MNLQNPMALTLVYLSAMIVTAPIAKRLGLGAVLGYLIAGGLIGPYALGLVGAGQENVLHLAEFGIIMMLFLIGLELRPALLWKMRGPIFGLGGLQVGLTALAILGIAVLAGQPWQIGLVVGMLLSSSSTAIVIQTLQEKGLLKSTAGETSFAVLLFQDIAVIPMFSVFPLLAASLGAQAVSPSETASGMVQVLRLLGAVALVVGIGKLFVRPVFRVVASSHLRELSTALALLVVLATTLLMNFVGLSPALGAFLAGVVLADSEYRHELEADIEPFKGLLLAIFFISVGAGIDFGFIARHPGLIAILVASLIVIKLIILFAIGVFAKLPKPDRLLFAFSLAQGGEFAFVLIGFAKQAGILGPDPCQALTAAVALSMAMAPLLIQSYAKWIAPRFESAGAERDPDEIDEKTNPVIVAGFGRFGQGVTRFLKAVGVRSTVLDFDAEQVDVLRKFGNKAFYGDASRMDLLRSAGADQAKILVIAIDDKDKTLQIVEQAQKEFPHLKILARAYDRIHAYEIIHRGVTDVYVETAGSSLNVGIDVLRRLGYRGNQAFQFAQTFKKMNERSILELARVYKEQDEETFITHSKGWLSALEQTLQADFRPVRKEVDRAWESAPRAFKESLNP